MLDVIVASSGLFDRAQAGDLVEESFFMRSSTCITQQQVESDAPLTLVSLVDSAWPFEEGKDALDAFGRSTEDVSEAGSGLVSSGMRSFAMSLRPWVKLLGSGASSSRKSMGEVKKLSKSLLVPSSAEDRLGSRGIKRSEKMSKEEEHSAPDTLPGLGEVGLRPRGLK